MASIVPSANPSIKALRSSREASGGFILKCESYATSSSINVKWCGVTSQLTRSLRDFAQRTCSSEALAERCAICRRAPVSSASCTSRATQTDSAAAGIPRKPSRVDVTPSRITAPHASETSSACSITVKSSDRQYSITCRASLAVAMGFPSSETATIPASFIPAISAMASPLLPIEAAPIGHTRTLPVVFARSRMNRVTEALSFTGFVFGMQQTAVKPPRAAALVPVSIVSEDSCPGSRRCACRSMNPGATISPVASKTSTSCGAAIFPTGATSLIFSPSSKTSIAASVLLAGSITRPFLIRSIGGFLGLRFQRRVRAAFRGAADQQIKDGHAYCDPVRHLLQHARLRSIRHVGRNLDSAIDRTGMQDNRVAVGTPQPLGIELVEQDVIVRRERRIVQPFGLHAQHHNDVRVFQRFLHPVNAANLRARRNLLQLRRHPDRRPAQRKPAAEFSQQMNVRTCHPAVQNIAQNRHVQIFDGAQPVPERQPGHQALRRMFVRAIARVHHRNIQMPGYIIRRSRRRMPHDQAVSHHRIHVQLGIQQRLALIHAGSLGLQVHGVGAQPRRGRSKADARARRVLKKCQCHSLSAQCREFFQRVPLDFLKRFTLVKKKTEFVRSKRLESEEIAKAVSQCPFSDHKIASPNRQSKITPRGRPAPRALPCQSPASAPR